MRAQQFLHLRRREIYDHKSIWPLEKRLNELPEAEIPEIELKEAIQFHDHIIQISIVSCVRRDRNNGSSGAGISWGVLGLCARCQNKLEKLTA